MKTIKILFNKRTGFIFLRNVNTFHSTNKLIMAKSKKDSCEMTLLHRKRREDRFMYGPLTKKEEQTLKESSNTSQSTNLLMDTELWWQLKNSKYMSKMHISANKFTTTKTKKIKVSKKMINTLDQASKSSINEGLASAKKIKVSKKMINALDQGPKSSINKAVASTKKIKVSKKMINALDQAPKSSIKKAVVSAEKNINTKSVLVKDVKEVEITCDKQNTENKLDNASETVDIVDKEKMQPLEDIKLLDVVINNMTSFPILNFNKNLPENRGKIDILSISARDEPTTLHYPSVTKILAATLSPESQRALTLWKAKLIAEMGEDKFNEYYQEQLKSGQLFHSCIENALYGRSVDIPDEIQPAFNSLSKIVEGLEDIKAIESLVSHNHLRYKGKVDCIAVYKGELCIIDWKKSAKAKSSLALTYDAPVQIAAYIGALNYSKSYPFTVNRGLIVVGYTNGKPADTYLVKDNVLKTYWKKWLTKLQKYWYSVSKKD